MRSQKKNLQGVDIESKPEQCIAHGSQDTWQHNREPIVGEKTLCVCASYGMLSFFAIFCLLYLHYDGTQSPYLGEVYLRSFWCDSFYMLRLLVTQRKDIEM